MIDKYLNKITCGDCYELIKELPDKSVQLIYTDIPYDLEDNGGGGSFGEKNRNYHYEYEAVSVNTNASRVYKSTMKSIDNIKEIAFGIDYSILDEFCRVCENIYVYIWCSKKQILPLMQYFVGEKKCRFEILTWHKTNPIPTCNGKYLSDTEYCLLFREDGKTKIGGDMSTKSKYYISSINKRDKDMFEHSTIKPYNFVKNHIINSTNEGDIVLDCFAGSGTVPAVCKELNRNFVAFEINEKWCKVANDRLNNIDTHGQISLFPR